MSWKNKLRPASFRGASFGVESHQTEQGRRTQVHEYPGRDDPYVEDLGLKAGTFSVRGFCIGADYMAARDKLLEACNQPGAGQLVHPYLGTQNVVCTAVSLSETADEGGMARFDLSFVVAGKNQYPAQTEDLIGSLLEKSDFLDSALGDWFSEVFSLNGVPDFLSVQAINDLTARLNKLSDLSSLLDLGKQSEFLQSVTGLLGSVKKLANVPADLAFQVLGAFTQLSGGFGRPLAGIQAMKLAFKKKPDYSAKRINDTHLLAAPLQQGIKNREAVASLFEIAALNAAVATAVLMPDDVHIELPQVGGDFSDGKSGGSNSRIAAKNERESLFESLDEAIITRRDLLAWIDAVAPDVPDAVYSALQDVRRAVVQAVPDAQNELPRLREITPKASLPVLVLAYSVHGDAARSGEMLRHNVAVHPGFMPVAPLRVLSD